jgi:release factor glutamine methyltransferase
MKQAVELLHNATEILNQAGIDSAHVDASLLLASVMKIERSQLSPFAEIPVVEAATFSELVNQRAKRIPLQHITGEAHFRHITLKVGAGVFVPRPETELLVEAGIESLCEIDSPRTAVDLCTGSGAIALSLACEVANTTVFAIEQSSDAFTWLQRNVEAHETQLEKVSSKVVCVQGDATDLALLAELAGSVDVVLSNPPYIPDAMIPRDPEARDHDPAMALFGGPDGLDVARGVARVAQMLLKPGCMFGMEHADVQGESVPELLDEIGGWSQVKDHVDYNKLPRFTTAMRSVTE